MYKTPRDRRRKVFERVVNPLLLKHLVPSSYTGTCIASNIPIKYLKYFKEVSSSRRAKKLDIDTEVNLNLPKLSNGRYTYIYQRPQSFAICTELIHFQFIIDS